MTHATRRRRWLLVATFVAVAVAGVVVVIFRGGTHGHDLSHVQQDAPLVQGPSPARADHSRSPTDESISQPPSTGLTPADVMGNPKCVMVPSDDKNLAVVLVPGDDGSRFAVINGGGLVFEGTLPFWSTHHPALARRPDGSILAGFGGAPEWGLALDGVVIYRDGQPIYESTVATSFGIADDGSSFFVVESMAGDVSRLAIRHVDLGIEVHHDLGDLHPTPDPPEARFTVNGSEVVVGPVDTIWSAVGHFGFFPTDGSEARELRLAFGSPGHRVFGSSNEGYFTTYAQLGGVSTTKRRFRYDNGEVSVEDEWSRGAWIFPSSHAGGWLAAEDGTHVHVLDASTGDTLFELPRAEDDHLVGIHGGRLVLHSTVANPEDLERCRGHRLQVDQTDGTSQERRLVEVTDEKACVEDLRERGLYRNVYDVYDLRTLADGNPPDHYRVEYGENPHCGSGDDPFGTLEVRNGQLVYVPRS